MVLSGAKRKKLFKSVLEKVTPTVEDSLEEQALAARVIERLEGIPGKHSRVVLAGSLARDTHLKGDKDLDFFVLFPVELDRKVLVEEGLRIAKKALKGSGWSISYAEHPYVKTNLEGHDIEIVPAFDVLEAKARKSSVDRSPLHVEYILSVLKKKQKAEVRLLKRFLKGIGVYGAELKVQGFSGYLCELLILYYGSFWNFLRKASKWSEPVIVQLKGKQSKKVLQEKYDSPLIVIDPTDPNRNVSACVSREKFFLLRAAAKEFTRKPSIEFFFPPRVKLLPGKAAAKRLEERGTIMVKVPYKRVHEDVVFGQMQRFSKKIARELEREDFTVARAEYFTDEEKSILLFFEVEEEELDKTRLHAGPPLSREKEAKDFLDKYKGKVVSGPRIEQGRLVVEVERKYLNAVEVIKDFLEKIRKEESKLYITKQISKRYKIVKGKSILRELKTREEKEFLAVYLRGREGFFF